MNSIALTIAGSDPSGGAGLQADIRTFQEIGVYGTSVVTLLTVQDSQEVREVQICDAELVSNQLLLLLEDLPPKAVKTGALGDSEVIACIVELARNWQFPLVVDPVMLSSSGTPLLDQDAQQMLVAELLPLAHVITPNIAEAEQMSGVAINSIDDIKEAARQIAALGAKNVLITGGHLPGKLSDQATDILFADGEFQLLTDEHVTAEGGDIHGTGCVLSAAITSYLAIGEPLAQAVRSAKQFTRLAIRRSRQLGSGSALMTLK